MHTIAKISLLIFLYYLVYYLYNGLIQPIPALGDSFDYHIPIAYSFLNGTILTLPNSNSQWYYPGSSEAVLSLMILLHLPLTISNILAIILLFFCCYKLAKIFLKNNEFSILFASTITTLTAIVRWMNAISIDVWVAVFFTISIIILERPQKNWQYFAKLGFTFGMLVGSKYSAWFFILTFMFFYFRKLLPFLSLSKITAFLIPFSVLGLSWYLRNYLLTQNPIYPLTLFGFKGLNLFSSTTGNIMIHYPFNFLNGLFSEYKLWSLSILVAIIFLVHKFCIAKNFKIIGIDKLFLIGILNMIFFTVYPSSSQQWIIVSSFRYSYPFFIPLILGVFLLAEKYQKEELLGFFAVASMINILSMAYYPKLLLVYFPLALIILYFLKLPKTS